MGDGAIAVLTGKSKQAILAAGGSGSWVLNPRHVRSSRHLVCVRNGKNHDPGADEPHGTAFLVGEIGGLARLPDQDGRPRWLIKLGAVADVGVSEAWRGWRNPVRYTTLEELGIAVGDLTFRPVAVSPGADVSGSVSSIQPLSIAQAKAGLAATFGVEASAIEIIIRA